MCKCPLKMQNYKCVAPQESILQFYPVKTNSFNRISSDNILVHEFISTINTLKNLRSETIFNN